MTKTLIWRHKYSFVIAHERVMTRAPAVGEVRYFEPDTAGGTPLGSVLDVCSTLVAGWDAEPPRAQIFTHPPDSQFERGYAVMQFCVILGLL